MYFDPSDIPPAQRRQWREEERAVCLYEEPGCFGLSVASVENLTDRTPEKWERELDRMEETETPWQREGELY